jgi:acyl dehydratase
MAIDEELITNLRAHIGQTTQKHLGELTVSTIRRYARAVGETNPLYYDITVAQNAGYKNIMAPPNLIPSVVDWSEGSPEEGLRLDGTESGDHLLGVPASGVRVMGGGEDMEFRLPAIAGNQITMESRLDAVELRESSSGPMVILTYQNTYLNEEDQVLLTTTRTVLLR